MQGDSQIREALERNVKAVSARPGIARGTARTTAVLRAGLDCTVTDGAHVLKVGMTPKYGGLGDAPNPGVLGRGALASCLAVGYGIWSARLGVPFEAIEVEVQADYDVRGELGVADDTRPGYLAMRYVVTVTSASPEADVLRVLDAADRCSSYRDIFSNGVPLAREVRINTAAV
jgi:uncharacterized OsmC-like protein